MGKYRLMAIDDDPVVLDAYRSLFPPRNKMFDEVVNLLESSDFEGDGEDVEFDFSLECFLNGQKGVAALRQSLEDESPFSAIFLDMRMPNGWSGLETAQQIRKLDEDVRIILVSAYTDHSLQQIRAKIGPRFVFHGKPWNDQELEQLTRLLVSDWGYEKELQETQRQLQDASAEVVAANQAKDQFLASMSHELRTPLTALLGYGDLLEETPLQQHQYALLKTMQISGSTLLYLLNDILDLSKIESGRFEIDHVPYNLAGMVDEVVRIFAVKAESAGLQFEVDRVQEDAAFSHQLLGDGKRLAQVLINLISNAIKFTQQGGVKLKVYSDSERLYCVVEDSGIGMASEVLSRLFKPFEQADRSISGRFGGTGLGLHISKTLVKLMGGDITVHSEEGKGSRFEVAIPLVLGDPVVQSEGSFVAPSRKSLLQGNVLIAEDVPELQILARRMVEATGATVDVVSDGRAALQRALQFPFNLILMDMQMPIMDGIAAARALRDQGCRVPIVALTANAMESHRQQCEAAGCNGFLTKPIDKAMLEGVLGTYLQEGEAEIQQQNDLDPDLLEIFYSGMDERKQELIAAASARDWQQISQVAHKIKGTSASFGFPELGDLAAEVCDMYGSGDQEQTAKLAMSLIMEISAVLP